MIVPRHISVQPVTLRCGEGRCELLPALGGSLGGWTLQGQSLLRPATAGALQRSDPFGSAGFPLVPFSNRIAQGQFAWGARQVTLAPNFWPEPHAIHGLGFEQPWQLQDCDVRSARLALRHAGSSAWPYPFLAEQRYVLEAHALIIEMRVRNLAESSVPLAFGHHPYFPREGARLQFSADHLWLIGEDGLPMLRVKPSNGFDFSHMASVARRDVDHCFTGWDGLARIAWEGKPWALQIHASPNLRCAVLYSSSSKNEFCFEPVPHLNDAINRATDYPMPIVAPGGSFESRIELRALAADPS